MKQIFILLFFFACFTTYSQGLEERFRSLNEQLIKNGLGNEIEVLNIDELPLEQDDTVKKPLVEKLIGFEYFDHLVNNYESFKNEFKVIDINIDGLLDIFYSGYLGGADDAHSYIFLNTGTGFKLSFEGEIGSEFIYAIKNSGKLCGLLSYFIGTFAPIPQIIRIDIVTYEGELRKVENISKYFDSIEVPSEFLDSAIEFTVLNEKYYLRTEPEINNEPDEYGYVGNIVETYAKGTKGKAIARKSDETGRIWWFVILEDHFAGWMSSRFLEKKIIQNKL